MRNLMIYTIACFLLQPVMILADDGTDNKGGRQIVIDTDGDIEADVLAEIVEKVESELSNENADVRVFITAEEALDMAEQYDNPIRQRGHKNVRVIKTGSQSGEHHERSYGAGHHRSMSEGAAKCVLKNIDKINSNAAAHLVMEACGALNESEE